MNGENVFQLRVFEAATPYTRGKRAADKVVHFIERSFWYTEYWMWQFNINRNLYAGF